jgi:hypothetical protein
VQSCAEHDDRCVLVLSFSLNFYPVFVTFPSRFPFNLNLADVKPNFRRAFRGITIKFMQNACYGSHGICVMRYNQHLFSVRDRERRKLTDTSSIVCPRVPHGRILICRIWKASRKGENDTASKHLQLLVRILMESGVLLSANSIAHVLTWFGRSKFLFTCSEQWQVIFEASVSEKHAKLICNVGVM